MGDVHQGSEWEPALSPIPSSEQTSSSCVTLMRFRTSPTTRRQSSSSVKSIHTCCQPDPTARPTTTEARQGEGRSHNNQHLRLVISLQQHQSKLQISKLSSSNWSKSKMCNSKVNERKCKTAALLVAQEFSRFHLFKMKESGVTLVVIHINIYQLSMCCDQTMSMLNLVCLFTSDFKNEINHSDLSLCLFTSVVPCTGNLSS